VIHPDIPQFQLRLSVNRQTRSLYPNPAQIRLAFSFTRPLLSPWALYCTSHRSFVSLAASGAEVSWKQIEGTTSPSTPTVASCPRLGVAAIAYRSPPTTLATSLGGDIGSTITLSPNTSPLVCNVSHSCFIRVNRSR